MTIENDPAVAELRESPFFVLNGPQGRRLACQWSQWDNDANKAAGAEFEIVCPETPETMGMLFGLYRNGVFSMRGALRLHDEPNVFPMHAFAPEHDLDQSWRGTIDDVLEVGHDWDMGPDGLLVISDPEEPAVDPEDRCGGLMLAA